MGRSNGVTGPGVNSAPVAVGISYEENPIAPICNCSPEIVETIGAILYHTKESEVHPGHWILASSLVIEPLPVKSIYDIRTI